MLSPTYTLSALEAETIREMYEKYGQLSTFHLVYRLNINSTKAQWIVQNIHTDRQLEEATQSKTFT